MLRTTRLLPFLCLVLAACQPMAPVAPAASTPTPPVAGLAFGPLTKAQVLALRRPPKEALGGRSAAQVIAAWEAPAAHRAGNWEFVVGGGFPADAAEDAPESTGALLAASFEAWSPAYATAWAPDAVEAPNPEPAAPRVFTSASKHGALTIDAVAKVALAVTFEPVPTEAEVPVSREAAQAAFTKAYADAKATGSEDATGADHFTGLPFTNVDRYPGGCFEFVPREGETLTSEAEPAVEFYAPVLERRLGKRVWRVVEKYPPACLVGPTLETIFNKQTQMGFMRVHGAGGYVDAETGAVVRLRRSYNVHGVLGM